MTPAIDSLLSDTSVIVKKYNKAAMASGENFNLFSILQVENDEVRTHSRFLAALLNPKGAHGKGVLFLSLFKERFAKEYTLDLESAKIHVEYYIGKVTSEAGGRIDILIRDRAGNVVMIENKIYAKEGHVQLPRYLKHFPDGRLLFLTLFGHESTQKDIKGKYLPVSYSVNIVSWLEDCAKESADAPFLHQNIKQYTDLIKKLTNQNQNKHMSNEVLAKVYQNKESFEAYTALVNTQNEVFSDTFREIISPLLNKTAEDLNLTLNIDRQKFKSHSNRYLGFSFSIKSEGRSYPNITFQFQGANYSNLQFGLTKTNEEDQLFKTPEDLLEKFGALFGATEQSKYWFAYKNYAEYFNWNDLNTLSDIRFGNFQLDFHRKVEGMLEIIESHWGLATMEAALQKVS